MFEKEEQRGREGGGRRLKEKQAECAVGGHWAWAQQQALNALFLGICRRCSAGSSCMIGKQISLVVRGVHI